MLVEAVEVYFIHFNQLNMVVCWVQISLELTELPVELATAVPEVVVSAVADVVPDAADEVEAPVVVIAEVSKAPVSAAMADCTVVLCAPATGVVSSPQAAAALASCGP